MAEIWQWNTETTAAKVRSGEVSAREVTEAHLARLDVVNPVLNAVTNDVRDEALAAAATLDESMVSTGAVGPLHGVPVTIKENIDVAGQATPNGMEALADVVAPDDSPLVANLRDAGAVIIGRTNTPEMSYRWHTDNPLRGETRNPWSSKRTPGGSSGGAASSVAAGVATIAHGNDLGGSIRQPANCCGLAGIRPSLGRVPAFNHSAPPDRTISLQLMSVQGPLAREVADVRAALEVMIQPSPHDPWHRYAPLSGPDTNPKRVAATYGLGAIDPEVRSAVDIAAGHLADAGYEVEFIDPPALDQIVTGWRTILATETLATTDPAFLQTLSSEFQRAAGWMFDKATLDVAGLVAAYAARHTVLREWTLFLSQRPLVLAPVSQLVPFAPNEDAASKQRMFELLEAHTMLVAVNYLGLPAAAVPSLLTPDGPLGVQIIGAPFAEGTCLDAAASIEARTGVMTKHLWDGFDGALI